MHVWERPRAAFMSSRCTCVCVCVCVCVGGGGGGGGGGAFVYDLLCIGLQDITLTLGGKHGIVNKEKTAHNLR